MATAKKKASKARKHATGGGADRIKSQKTDTKKARASHFEDQPATSTQLSQVENQLTARLDWLTELLTGEVATHGSPTSTDDRPPDRPGAGSVVDVNAAQVTAGEWFVETSADDLESIADSLAIVAHPVRLRILHTASTHSVRVTQILEALRLRTTGQVYHHLRILTEAGWVVSDGAGNYWVPRGRLSALDGVLRLGIELRDIHPKVVN
ncbi:ArsR/SmtB family transcription factor [Flaviflexus massiliensis]|uniref:ArsR/SmtB family transcription factor n=1 Tax=Flaviflexus massiliensis TaxID=1522309 RepID=UPI0006D58504|nr:winged helix-turn-helix domain-containing protein [Flaviflexus massiliensis]